MSAKSKDGRRRKLKVLVDRVVNILNSAGKKYVIIRFPSSHRERSIDLIAVGGCAADVIIRVKMDSVVSRDEANDILKASLALDSVPIVVSDDPELYDNIVYERSNVYVMNERTLENMYLKPTELITLYRKGELYLSVNKDALQEEMRRRMLSIGDISYLTRISRRTIHKYRSEGGMITIESAEKLVSAVGERVIESISFKHIAESVKLRVKECGIVKSSENPKLEERLLSEGEVYDLRKSAPDYLISGEELKAIVDATPMRRRALRDVVRKTIECVKMSEVLGIDVNVVTGRENAELVKDELSTAVSLNRVNLEKLE